MNKNPMSESEVKSDYRNQEPAFTHLALTEITKKTLNEVLQRDPLLSDLPIDITLEEVLQQIAVQHGQSMTLYIVKANNEEIPVVVNMKATVLDLKKAVQRHMNLQLVRKGLKIKISWKYIWRTYSLTFGKERLVNENVLLTDIGLKNRCKIGFMKKSREKGVIIEK